ncbi:MAG: glycosyltransferase [Balneolaceae bacterium]|nr:MAG: glycosyltransferase [Balneolaceae bacterium]
MGKKILIISPVPVFPWHAGNRMRIKSICDALITRGCELDFFYIGFDEKLSENHYTFFNGQVLDHLIDDTTTNFVKEPVLRIQEIVNGLKTRAGYFQRRLKYGEDSARFNKSLSEFKSIKKQRLLKEQIQKNIYDGVLLNYTVYSHLFDLFDDNVIKIIDTHDRLSDRYTLFLEEGVEPVIWKSISSADEKKSLSKADVILAITQKEAEYFRELIKVSKPDILTVTHLSPYDEVPLSAGRSGKTIITVGGKSEINLNGLNWFLDKVWRHITKKFNDAELLVAGSLCEQSSAFVYNENVTLLGRFDSTHEVYDKAGLCVNPIQFGTGLKIKTIEALSSGKKIITTKEGASGLERFIGKGLVMSDSPEEWVREISSHFECEENTADFKETLKAEVHKYNEEAFRNIYKAVQLETETLS